MKRFTVIALVCVIALAACSPNLLAPAPNASAPTANVAGTVNAMVQAANAQTLTAQPSPTATAIPTDTFTAVADSPTTPANTDTPVPNLTTTPATATSGPANPAATSTPTLVPGKPTASPTNGVMTYGTLPPANRPYVGATLINKAQREVYISLQVVTDQGYTIIEYPVKTVVKVKIPTGDYTYVAWVGGRQMIGYFHVRPNSDVTINIFKDKIVVTQISYP